jgi:helicase
MRLNPFIRILGLSATLGNRQELADWLRGLEYCSDQRPFRLRGRLCATSDRKTSPIC